jgi:uncharacterized protein (DUF3820 family)
MTTHTMPFGKHKGKPPGDVPQDYLTWFLKTCKLSPGLRAAVHDVLLQRGADPSNLPPEPEPNPAPCCRGCGGDDLALCWQLHRASEDGVFRLSARGAGRLLGVAPERALRWLRRLEYGVLECVERGGPGGKATSYRWVGGGGT